MTCSCPENWAGLCHNSRFQMLPYNSSAPTVRMNGQTVTNCLIGSSMLKFYATPFYCFIFVLQGFLSTLHSTDKTNRIHYCSYFCFYRHQSHPVPPPLLALFQLYQNTSTVLRMQEDDGLIMRSNLWLRIESPNIFCRQILDSSVHIIHLECVGKTLFTELPSAPTRPMFLSFVSLPQYRCGEYLRPCSSPKTWRWDSSRPKDGAVQSWCSQD